VSEQMLSIEGAAHRLGVSASTVKRMAKDGRLESVKVGKSVRITPASIAAMSGAPEPAADEREILALLRELVMMVRELLAAAMPGTAPATVTVLAA
jgi:excisionase family DNA binding protein